MRSTLNRTQILGGETVGSRKATLAPPSRWRIRGDASPSATLLHLIALVYAALGLTALLISISAGSPSSPVARPDVLSAASAQLLAAGREPDRAAALAQRELRLRPYDAAAWCRLADARYQKVGRVDDAVEDLLWRSYAAAPIDVDAFAWRSEFMFDHWPSMTPRLRKRASQEVAAFAGVWETKALVESVFANVEDPSGRLALVLMLRAKAQQPAPRARR